MSVACWGAGASGAIGSGELKEELLPVVAEGQLRGKHVVDISCGEQHSVALDDLGNVYCWGRNREGQCGQNSAALTFASPTRVDSILHERIVKVIAGGHQTFALTADGNIYRWGLFHELMPQNTGIAAYFGIGNVQHSAELKDMIDRSHYLYFSNKQDFGEEDDNYEEKVASTGSLRRRTIRVPELLQLPVPDVIDGREKVPADEFAVTIAAGYGFHLIVTASGSIYSFGFNDKGQLGHGDRFAREKPTRITALAPYKIIRVAAGQAHSVAVTEEGHILTWGGGVFGIGHGNGDDVLVPRIISALSHVAIREVSCGTYHTFCLAADGSVYSFGHGEYGQQGTGDVGEGGEQSRNALLPRLFEMSGQTAAFAAITCGHLHTLFRLEDGSLWSCGWGANGVLGHGDKKYRVIPARIRALDGDLILAAAGGWKHNVVIKEGSTTFAFDFEKLLSNSQRTDVTFVVDGKPIHAHSVLVAARCAKLRAMMNLHARFCRDLPKRSGIVIENTRFVVFNAFLRYIYTDHLKVPTFFVPEVAKLARTMGIGRLVALCERLVTTGRAPRGATSTESTFAADMIEMVDNALYSDVAFDFLEPDKSIARIHAHKALLTSRCAYFKTLWDNDAGFQDADRSVLSMRDCPVSSSIFRVILAYLYAGSRDLVTADNAIEMLAAADYFLLDDLKQVCEDVIEKSLLNDDEQAEDVELVTDIRESARAFSARRLDAFCEAQLQLLRGDAPLPVVVN